jgi:hypothetical protein
LPRAGPAKQNVDARVGLRQLILEEAGERRKIATGTVNAGTARAGTTYVIGCVSAVGLSML